MKHRASLILMELTVMVLVFALGAALCLLVLARSNEIALQTRQLDGAAVLAANAAQVLQHTRGDIPAALSLESGDYRLEIEKENPGVPGLGQASVAVYLENRQLVVLRTGWQEGIP